MSEVLEQLSAEQIAKNYSALLDSVGLIEGYVAGKYGDRDIVKDEESKATVERNVGHLEYMKSKKYWTNEDFSKIDAAIKAGKAYIA